MWYPMKRSLKWGTRFALLLGALVGFAIPGPGSAQTINGSDVPRWDSVPTGRSLTDDILTTNQITGAETFTVYVTFYGYVDNDPPGRSIAYPQIHPEAGGTGTFADPISFATDPREHAPGTIVYVPYLEKYFIMEDLCASCRRDWSMVPPRRHIDLWTGGDEDSGDDLIQCEKFLTRARAQVIVNPPDNLPVNTQLLFDAKTGECFRP